MRLGAMPIESVYRMDRSTEIFVLHCSKRPHHAVRREINVYADDGSESAWTEDSEGAGLTDTTPLSGRGTLTPPNGVSGWKPRPRASPPPLAPYNPTPSQISSAY